jgi:NAD(P)-dependent dehydrogenase (short-subunit alcohol dehydrogenase family)
VRQGSNPIQNLIAAARPKDRQEYRSALASTWGRRCGQRLRRDIEFAAANGTILRQVRSGSKHQTEAGNAMAENLRLAGKVAVITGAGSGIGKATALLFLREGASVVAACYEPGDREALEGVARGLPGSLTTVEADVTRDRDAQRIVRTAVEQYDGLDILVNCAGISISASATETSEELWQQLLDVNLKGVFLCSKHAVAEMLRKPPGSIVNVASINAIRGNHRLVAYSASKGGVVGVTLAMALDHAADNIRVNCVCPAAIEGTRMMQRSLEAARDVEEVRRYLVAKHPMGRCGRPEEVAYAILFLASDEASFITGVVLPIDGGRSIR